MQLGLSLKVTRFTRSNLIRQVVPVRRVDPLPDDAERQSGTDFHSPDAARQAEDAIRSSGHGLLSFQPFPKLSRILGRTPAASAHHIRSDVHVLLCKSGHLLRRHSECCLSILQTGDACIRLCQDRTVRGHRIPADNFEHRLRPRRTVHAQHIDAQRNEHVGRSRRVGTHETDEILPVRHRCHHRQIRILSDRHHGDLDFLKVRERLQQKEIDSSLGQSHRLFPERIVRLFEREGAHGLDELSRGAHTAGHPRTVSDHTLGQLRSPMIDLFRLLT